MVARCATTLHLTTPRACARMPPCPCCLPACRRDPGRRAEARQQPLAQHTGCVGWPAAFTLALFPASARRHLHRSHTHTLSPASAFTGSLAAGGGLLGLFVVQSGLIALRSALLNISGERIAARLRNGLFKAVMSHVRVVVTIMTALARR